MHVCVDREDQSILCTYVFRSYMTLKCIIGGTVNTLVVNVNALLFLGFGRNTKREFNHK